jgi:hypothetical protein
MRAISFVALPDVAARIKPLRPKFARKHGRPLKVAPRSTRYMLIGTAFDYLLRFELQRRMPHAVATHWVAESAIDRIHHQTGSVSTTLDLLTAAPPDQYIPPDEVVSRIRRLLKAAKTSLESFRQLGQPSATKHAEMAAHAIRLAKVDSVIRAMRLEPTFEEAKADDVQELVDLLAVVPFDKFAASKTMLLNPSFGEASRLVGGADADLIADCTLVDFKTTTKEEIEGKSLDQLLGYFLLARRENLTNPSFPALNRVGLYFSRHGHLWIQEVSVWTSHPEFLAVEEWFFKRAGELFKPAKV